MSENELLEDGMYEGEVVKAEIIDSEYMVHKEWNPNGTCLNLWIDVEYEDGSGTKRLFVRQNKTQANKIFESYNKPTVDDLNNAKPEFLKNKTVYVEVQQYTSKAGKVSNIVKKIEPIVSAPVSAPAKAKTAKKKAEVEF